MWKTKVRTNKQGRNMEKIKFLKAGSLAELKSNLKAIADRYDSQAPWLDEFFGTQNWVGESTREIADGISLLMPDGQKLFDLENTKILYTALRDIPLSLAIDERFWAYMTHVTFWDYMRVRWPLKSAMETQKPDGYLREHYLFMANRDRALIRNGISRLWWYGHVSYDESRANPFELTEVLLEKLDIAQQLLERSYSRNATITKTILSLLVERKAAGTPFSHRSKFRPLTMHLNTVGGVTILDALVESDIRNLAEAKLEQLAEKTTSDALEVSPEPIPA